MSTSYIFGTLPSNANTPLHSGCLFSETQMSIKYEHARYIPTDKTTDMITSVRLAQIEPTRVAANAYSTFTDIGTDSPFNPSLNAPVTYSPKIALTTNNRPPTSKYDNNYVMSNNTALFDPRVYNKDLQPYFINNLQDKQLRENSQQRIRLKEDLVPNVQNGDYVGNGFKYNPYLPESPTNVKPSTPALKDERLHAWHTNDRQWNYESDRAITADNLRRSQDLKDRNARQRDADCALQRCGHRDRNYEIKQEYRKPTAPTTPYTLTAEQQRQTTKQNDRSTVPEHKQKEKFSRSRNEFNANDINHLTAAIDRSFSTNVTHQQTANFINANFKTRTEQFSSDKAVKEAKGNTATSMIEDALTYVADTILGAFSWNANRTRDTITKKEAFADAKTTLNKVHNAKFDSDGSILVPYKEDLATTTDNTQATTRTFTSAIQRDPYDKRNHMLIVKNGDLLDAYPDEDLNYTAVSFIDKDPLTQSGFNRHIVMLDGGKLTIIQKRAEDAIFDGNKLDQDVIVVELPIEAIDHKVRERIHKLNMGSQRDRVLELTYDDFVLFTNYLIKHQNLAKRVKLEQLHYRVRGNTYDEDIISNFEGRKTFTSDAVYNDLAKNAREHLINHRRGRVDKVIERQGEELTPQNPINVHLKRDSVEPPKLSLPRNVGVKRNQFD